MTGSLLRALVMRDRWLLARPAARATDLAPPAGLRWFRAGRSRSFLERACHAHRLVLGSSGSSRHWSRSALVFAVCACCTTQSPGGSSVGLAPRWSLPPTSPVPLSPSRARIPLEFGYSRQFHTRGCYSFDCPASQVKKTEVRPDCSFAPTQLALCLRLATTYKARAATCRNPRGLDSTMQN